MKLILVILSLVGSVFADVAHLSHTYLPPHISSMSQNQHVTYNQGSHEVAQPVIVELVDNFVVEDVPAREQVQNAHFVDDAEITDAHVTDYIHNADIIAHQVQAHAHQAIAAGVNIEEPVSEVYHTTQQQGGYYTETRQQQPEEEYTQQYYTIPIVTEQVPQQQQYSESLGYNQQSVSLGSSASSGIDTQYAANGGYVY